MGAPLKSLRCGYRGAVVGSTIESENMQIWKSIFIRMHLKREMDKHHRIVCFVIAAINNRLSMNADHVSHFQSRSSFCDAIRDSRSRPPQTQNGNGEW